MGLAVIAAHSLVPPAVRNTIERRSSAKFTGKISGWPSTIRAIRPTTSVSSSTQHWSMDIPKSGAGVVSVFMWTHVTYCAGPPLGPLGP